MFYKSYKNVDFKLQEYIKKSIQKSIIYKIKLNKYIDRIESIDRIENIAKLNNKFILFDIIHSIYKFVFL